MEMDLGNTLKIHAFIGICVYKDRVAYIIRVSVRVCISVSEKKNTYRFAVAFDVRSDRRPSRQGFLRVP
jgi:hypothetical protein